MTHENLSELLASLPGDNETSAVPSPDLPREQLRQILGQLARRPVPVHSLHRLWTMGELSAEIALAYSALWVRQWFAGSETRQRNAMETNLQVALKLFYRLGYLRGAMTKLGQTAGHFPNVLPSQIAGAMERLHFDAPPMHYSLIREVVYDEFGQEPGELFAAFEKDAFAAASLGQVHRARLKSGEEVAVKIQYPGIARTIDADFRNLGALLFPMRLSSDWEYVEAQFAAIRRMLKQEVDFLQEAESQRKARELFVPEDGIWVPRVYDDYSTARVLTTEYIPGMHLDEFLASNPTQARRNEFGAKLERTHLRMYFAYMNYADPSPGNFLFLDDGRLGMIDFGCIQYFDATEREILRQCERLIDEDESVVPELVKLTTGIPPDDPRYQTYVDLMGRSRDWMMEPMRANGPFDFGDEGHLQRGFAWFSSAIRDRTVHGHPMYVYYHRCVFGMKSILYRLRAQVDLRAIHRRERQRWLERAS
jgi:aarF domain-containing kinase